MSSSHLPWIPFLAAAFARIAPDRANDHYAVDISRARDLLGWQPKRSLRESLPKMVEALKANPAQWHEDNGLTPRPRGFAGANA